MTDLTNTDRFQSPLTETYVFKGPAGDILQYVGISTRTYTVNTEVLPLYWFSYVTAAGVSHTLDVDKDLNIQYVDGVAQTLPYATISYTFTQTKFSILVALNDAESKFEYAPAVSLSEAQALGTINSNNYLTIKEIFKDRLVGALNIRFTRDQNGLLTVDACVVNEGVDPLWS